MRRTAFLLVAIVLAAPAAAQAARSVPPGWAGVVADGSLFDPSVNQTAEFDTMVSAGVESIRASVYWNSAQPYRTWDEVPEVERPRFEDAGGVPTDFSAPDAVVAQAAAHGIGVLPVVLWGPPWARVHRDLITSPPNAAAYAAFVEQLARRYGPKGTFWKKRSDLPRRPVRDWQIWNEPTIEGFWSDQPFVKRYVALLRATRPRLKAADPGARLVLAGLVYESWKPLAQIYAAGARKLFDVVAVHPFTNRIGNLVLILEYVRRVMARNGDERKPVLVTELSYPSSLGKAERFGYETTEAGQASRLGRAFDRLARERRRLRIERVYWYTWMSPDTGNYPFAYAGLRRLEPGGVVAKPAFPAYRTTVLRLEGCKAKARVATGCALRAR